MVEVRFICLEFTQYVHKRILHTHDSLTSRPTWLCFFLPYSLLGLNTVWLVVGKVLLFPSQPAVFLLFCLSCFKEFMSKCFYLPVEFPCGFGWVYVMSVRRIFCSWAVGLVFLESSNSLRSSKTFLSWIFFRLFSCASWLYLCMHGRGKGTEELFVDIKNRGILVYY